MSTAFAYALKKHTRGKLWGKLFGDKGYLSKPLFKDLVKSGLKLVTGVRKNMKNKLMEMQEKVLLRKRSVVETVNDQWRQRVRRRACAATIRFFVALRERGLSDGPFKFRAWKQKTHQVKTQCVFDCSNGPDALAERSEKENTI